LWEKSQFDLIKVIRCYLGNYYSAEYDMVSEFQAICNLPASIPEKKHPPIFGVYRGTFAKYYLGGFVFHTIEAVKDYLSANVLCALGAGHRQPFGGHSVEPCQGWHVPT